MKKMATKFTDTTASRSGVTHSAFAVALLLPTMPLAARADPTFTTIDLPESIFTNANGINARGDIIGAHEMRRGLGEKCTRLLVRAQQGLEFRPQRLVTVARLI